MPAATNPLLSLASLSLSLKPVNNIPYDFVDTFIQIFNYYVPHVLLTPPAPTKSTQQDKSAALFLFTNIPLFPGKVQWNIPRRCWELSI